MATLDQISADADQRAEELEDDFRRLALTLFAFELAMMVGALGRAVSPQAVVRSLRTSVSAYRSPTGLFRSRWEREFADLLFRSASDHARFDLPVFGGGVLGTVPAVPSNLRRAILDQSEEIARTVTAVSATKIEAVASAVESEAVDRGSKPPTPPVPPAPPGDQPPFDQRLETLVPLVGRKTAEEIMAVIRDGRANGLSISKVAQKLVEDVHSIEINAKRAETIARTECLPGDTPVNGARITAVYRRWYEGDLVEAVTHSGRKLSGTPNHPVLTTEGWRGLGELSKGDRILCQGISVEAAGAPRDQDVQNPPPSIAEIFEATAAIVVTERERTRKPDFHGDGTDGEVDVLRPDSILLVNDFAPIDERAIDGVLSPSDSGNVLFAALRAPFRRDLEVDTASGFGVGAQRESGLREHSSNEASADAELLGQRSRRCARLVAADYCGGWNIVPARRAAATLPVEVGARILQGPNNASFSESTIHPSRTDSLCDDDPLSAPTVQVEVDEVSVVRTVRNWAGHVYNLTTVDGYFSAAEIYTANTIGLVNMTEHERALSTGILNEKRWITQRDSRVRESHQLCEGQGWIPINERYRNGLMYPGERPAPAEEVIGCRCSQAFRFNTEPRQATPASTPRVTSEPPTIEQAPDVDRPKTILEGGKVDTFMQHTVDGLGHKGSRQLTSERQALHDKIVDDYFRESGATPVDKPEVFVMGGGASAGKSSMEKLLTLPENRLKVDVDKVRTKLPEWDAEGIAAKLQGRPESEHLGAYTHEEASYIAKRIVARGTEEGYTMLIDGVGDSGIEKMQSKVLNYKSLGAPVTANYITIDFDTAYARMRKRGDEMKARGEIPRYVPAAEMAEQHADVARTFYQGVQRGLFEQFTLWDNSGSGPVIVAEGRGTQLTIHRQDLWNAFLERGKGITLKPHQI